MGCYIVTPPLKALTGWDNVDLSTYRLALALMEIGNLLRNKVQEKNMSITQDLRGCYIFSLYLLDKTW